MNRKQLLTLYVLYLLPFTTGNAILPFLPIYVEKLGASPTIAGYYLAVSFGALALGTMVAGWLSERYGRRKQILLVAYFLNVLGLIAMAFAPSVLLLTIATCFVWFLGGIITTIILILTGIFADAEQRGRTFGILTTAVSLGAIIGGLYSGRVIDLWDFQGLFLFTAAINVLPPFVLPLLQDAPHVIQDKAKRDLPQISLGFIFWALFIASVLVNAANFSGGMIRPILMNSLEFDSQAIASTVSVTGLFTISLPYLVGWLSDKIGRKQLLIIVYLLIMAGLMVTTSAFDLWHFWAASIFGGIQSTGFALGSALLTDIIPPESLDMALSRYASTQWFGGVLGYMLTGMAMETFGIVNTLIVGAVVILIASLLVMTIKPAIRTQMVSA